MKLDERWINAISKSLKCAESEHLIILVSTDGVTDTNQNDENNNIYCVDKNFEIIWQISPLKPPFGETDSFVGLRKEGTRFLARRFFGDEFELNENTGQAEHIGWNK